MCSVSKIFLIPLQVNLSLSEMFSNCCKVCSEVVARAEDCFGGLLCTNLGLLLAVRLVMGKSLNFKIFVHFY